MADVEVTRDAMDAAERTLSGQGPVHMLNLVRYRAQAAYAQPSELAPCSGREAYLQRYAPAFARVAAAMAPGEHFAPVLLAGVQAMLIAPADEAWDDMVIVEYQDFTMLRRILESPQYEAEAAPHRRAALADWRFIATLKIDLPA